MEKGAAWNAIVIDKDFTNDLFLRICSVVPEKCYNITVTITQEVIDQSTVHIYSDLSSKEYSFCNFILKSVPRCSMLQAEILEPGMKSCVIFSYLVLDLYSIVKKLLNF